MAFYKQLAQRKGFFSKIPKYLYFWFYLRSKSKIGPFYPCLPYSTDRRYKVEQEKWQKWPKI